MLCVVRENNKEFTLKNNKLRICVEQRISIENGTLTYMRPCVSYNVLTVMILS